MKSSEANADARTEYTEDNPNPSFRPGVSALAYKLRTIKQLDNDEALLWVLDQLIFWRWVSKPNPDYVFKLLAKLYFYWGSALSRRETFGQSIESLKLEYLHFVPQQEAPPEIRSSGQGEQTSLTLPEAFSNLFKEQAKAIEEVIKTHQYEPFMKNGVNYPACTCNRRFDFWEEWARHVRLLIKRVVVDASSAEGR